MKTSIATVSISGELPEKLEAIAKAGFDGVEIFENDFLAFDGSPADVGKMVRDHGLEITLFQPFRDFEGMPATHRGRTFDRAERKFDVMQELGTDLVLVCSNVSPVSLGGIDRAAADFHELGERAAKRGLRVGYEALAWGRHINDHRDAWEIVRRADHPNVGLILDSFHTLSRKIDINSIRSIPKDKIFIVQLADAPLIDMDLLYWSRHFRNMPGEGDLPVTAFTTAIAETGYDGYFSLEIFNDQFRGGSSRAIADDGYRSLIYLGDQVRRSPNASALTVPDMPDRAKVKGVGFVEFSSDEKDAADLAAILRTLGFRKTAVHRTKKVSLYSQGDIRLLVNTDEKGFANASFAVHGTSAYAMALVVEDAGQAFERAVALGAEPFRQQVAKGEVEIPAIRGVGGGLVYLIDDKSNLGRFSEIDFQPVSEEGEAEVGQADLRHVDHIAQTVAYEELLTWLLFYTSIFETQKTPMVDIIDPAGVIRSQVVENASGTLRITLNGAENRRTLAGHFIAEKFGSGVQHLAFQTDDIFATAAALRKNGFKPLQISPNYYGDVEARFGLDAELSERLKEENILYDRDEHGEYFQLYSMTYGEGFFFEIVERRGYRGYGAPNAIFRIAALKKALRPEGMPRV
ncbi:sugar phosphate isomerase/epimerase and 4-hydroxyphenylpyruvate domain-containing protein [Neorhizobium galegae]|uniref:bifunctional sugar phosphate isomerase/epimerase/4-hydroxyphenylpyruvate dioxygenase family protein n=1 Tax=Neorhizobium galegae TaxID=399 RepID=UPI000621C2D9|nr:sugar phosphate isomerase/epimerase and 4-hydroxyphenylpyruvate domain-containing protein [Neorhizobium galegae]MCQ1778187.1 sugar phosphate isomerase/epimerase and 4-hydroxyphenylpyruvate domain-containing protein [Neorhizobium galegae]MCQ1800105.1 sugar phosphate isomerase/epimerase and 4-hydroxyphenylpyruvate domain-containing protein [Neorhizobium galegae]CDZ28095.1 4-hydroxyphenylpyruvate dioxygenase [Neorhizobium galegae bv. officinalis]